MKNFTYATLILLIIASCGRPAPSDNDKTSAEKRNMAAPADSVTLNGYTFAEAEIMVRSFLREGYSTEKQTSIWFSKTYIDNLYKILDFEVADGFRIYFAKKSGKNTIIIVSTKKSENIHPATSMPTHKDYFEHKSSFLQPGNNSEILGTRENGVPEALMYSAAGSDCTSVPCNTSVNTISCQDGHRWINQFNQGLKTTTSLWYPIELLKYWKLELDSAISNKAEGDGIRIYFAKKDNGSNIFVMTPTRIKNGKKRTDYYECYSKSLNTKFNEKRVADNGEECPNNCNDLTWQ